MTSLDETRRAWEDLLRTRRGSFGDIEHHEDPEGIFRGPIKKIMLDVQGLKVTTHWTAHLATDRRGNPIGTWNGYKPDGEVIEYALGSDDFPYLGPPQVQGNRVLFRVPFGLVVLIPKTERGLDRHRVLWT